MTQYIAELQAYHIQWQMQPKFSIDHTQIATIANMKKDELTEYISDNSIDPTHYGYQPFPTTVEEIRAAVIDIVLQIMEKQHINAMGSPPTKPPTPSPPSVSDVMEYQANSMHINNIQAHNLKAEMQILALKEKAFNAFMDACPKALRKHLEKDTEHRTQKASSDFLSLTTRIVQTANRGVCVQILLDCHSHTKHTHKHSESEATGQTGQFLL